MILQLLGVSLIAWVPQVVIIVGQYFFQPSFGNWFVTYILHYLPYVTASSSSFFALIGLPEIRKELKIKRYETKPTPKITDETLSHRATILSILVHDKNIIENVHI